MCQVVLLGVRGQSTELYSFKVMCQNFFLSLLLISAKPLIKTKIDLEFILYKVMSVNIKNNND